MKQLQALSFIWFITTFCCDVVASDLVSETAANKANSRLLALPETMRNTIFEIALSKKKIVCNTVNHSLFQRLDEQLIGYWTVGCENEMFYSIQIINNAQGSIKAKACHLVLDTAVPCNGQSGVNENADQRLALVEDAGTLEQEGLKREKEHEKEIMSAAVETEAVFEPDEPVTDSLLGESLGADASKNSDDHSGKRTNDKSTEGRYTESG